jgi:hypothetical protein
MYDTIIKEPYGLVKQAIHANEHLAIAGEYLYGLE